MPWTRKQQRLAQAIAHGFKPTGSASGFSQGFAHQVISESKTMPTLKAVKKKKGR